MKNICKHAYPADLCGTCNPAAKEKPDARRSAAACSASFVQVAAGKETWWEEITRLQSERDQYAAMLCEAMSVVYATTCRGDSTDLIDRFEALELTPAISSENDQIHPRRP